MSDLSQLHELRYSYRRDHRWNYLSPNGEKGVLNMTSLLYANNGNFLRDAAIMGKGVMIAPSFFFFEAFKNGSLVRLLPNHAFDEMGAYALYPPTRYLSARARALIDFLVNECGDEPYWDNIR